METKKEKKKANFWLEDQEFIKKSNFDDHYYLESLGKHISNFLKNAPVPILTTYDPQYKRIFFSIGTEKKGFNLDVNISYYDFITLVKRWLVSFYPQYNVEYEVDIPLSDDEIFVEVRKGVNLNDALLLTKKIIKQEKGVIEKIQLTEDEFILNVNGESQLRLAGSLQKPITLKSFLTQLRQIENDNEKRQFILNNSRELRHVQSNNKEILITYQGKQLYNFFVINYSDLKNQPLTEIDNFNYKWGRFKIKFESKSLLNDCLTYYNTQQELDASN